MDIQLVIPSILKNYPIYRSLDVIEVVQSYDRDWDFYLIDVDVKTVGEEFSEKLTPFPCTVGALSFRDFIFKEELLISVAKNFLNKNDIKNLEKILQVGYPVSSYLSEEVFRKILSEKPEIITEAIIEYYVPVNSKRGFKSKISSKVEKWDLVETEYLYLKPEEMIKLLNNCRSIREFLDKLSKNYNDLCKLDKGYILIFQFTYPADKTLRDLEKFLSQLLKPLEMKVLRRSLIFNRVIPA